MKQRRTINLEGISQQGIKQIEIEEITDEEARFKENLGTACGIDLFHCATIALRHSKEESRLKYFIERPRDEEVETFEKATNYFYKYTKVDFYGDLSVSS